MTFVEWGLQETKEFVPPAPPLMFSVPADVFYPFKLSAARSLRPSFGTHCKLSCASLHCSIACAHLLTPFPALLLLCCMCAANSAPWTALGDGLPLIRPRLCGVIRLW